MTAFKRESSPEDERRLRPRRNVFYDGLVTNNDGTRSFFCTIRNQTDVGALISIPDGQSMPPIIYLINLRDQIAYEALTVWTDGLVAGIAILASLPLTKLMASRHSTWNEIWARKSVRQEAGTELV